MLSLFAICQATAKVWSVSLWNYSNWKDKEKSFSYAVNESSDGDIIELEKNLTVTSDIEVYSDITVRSKNNTTCTIRNVGRYYICNVHPGGKLTLTNIVVDCENYSRREDLFHLKAMTVSSRGVTNVARMVLQNGATIKRVSLSSSSGNENAVFHVKQGAVLRIKEGAMIQNCNNQSSPGKGGAICCDYGTVIMTGGTITGCKAKGDGGAIHTDGTRVDAVEAQGINARGDIYLSGGYITNNACGAGMHGGAIYVGNSGPMIHITGSVVVSNNFSGTGSSAVSDDISTYLLENAYANRLKLTGHSDVNPSDFTTNGISFTGSVGVRYPLNVADPQGLRFGGAWEYFNSTQEEPRQFFWNGNGEYRGWIEGNALVWSRHYVHELPKDGDRVADLIENGAGSPLYIELNGDYEMKAPVHVPENYQIVVDLQGHEFKCDFHVDNSTGQVIIRDSSVMKSGKVSGHRESTSPTAFLLEGGSFQTYPPPEWVADDKVLIRNYCEVHPYMVATLAWQTNATSRLHDLTAVTRERIDEETRIVSGGEDISAITFSTGDWVNLEHTNSLRKVQVLAVAAVSNALDGTVSEAGERILLFDSELGLNSSEYISGSENSNARNANNANGATFGNEDEFVWNAMSYGLVKLLHITMTEQGESYVTNDVEQTYFQFPDAMFEATQRKNASKLRIMLTDALLKSAFDTDRASGFSEPGINTRLDEIQENGLRKWENIVTGTDDSEFLFSTASGGGDEARLDIALSNTNKQIRTETGYDVYYDIRKSTASGWVRVGDVSSSPSFSIPLLGEDGSSKGATGFYRVTTLIVPADELSVTNEIPSKNIVGVLEIDSPLANTLAAVPWVALEQDPEGADLVPVTVSNYLNTAHLEDNDAIQVANQGNIYKRWSWNKRDKKWNAATTVTKNAVYSATDAGEYPLPGNSAVWISRANSGNKPFFLVGQYSKNDVSLQIGGDESGDETFTLVSNPSFEPVRVNDYNWGTNPVKGDVIRIPNEKEAPLLLSWNGSEWGRLVKLPGERYSVWKNDAVVPAGTGFWYMRKGAAFEIKLPKSNPCTE